MTHCVKKESLARTVCVCVYEGGGLGLSEHQVDPKIIEIHDSLTLWGHFAGQVSLECMCVFVCHVQSNRLE